jgi:hypothetical protein
MVKLGEYDQAEDTAKQQRKSGFAEDARNTLLLAREAGLRTIEVAAARTANERRMGANNMKLVGEQQAKMGLTSSKREV